jgi:5-methylthioadenosine/S-adenosylhomocysteine deaminase
MVAVSAPAIVTLMDAPQPVDLRIDATWIVPVEPAGTLVDHAVVVDGERIVAVLPQSAADARYAPRGRIALPEHVLIPGLVNGHAHTAMTLMRGIADDVPLQPWLTEHIWPREGRFLSPDFVHDGTLLGAAEMLQGGVTCCNDMYFHPDAAARAYDAAGMRAMLGMPVLDFPTPYAADADAYLHNGLAARDAWKRSTRLRFALAPHAPYTVGDDTWRKVVMYAAQLDLPIETHLAETRTEVDEARARDGVAPLARLARLGATGPGFIAIHGVHLDDEDLALLAAHGCHVVHCPASNMKLASGIARVAAMRRRGINVALGTDGAASNNRQDLLAEMRLASLLAKVSTDDAAALPAHAALEMATLAGARALGMDERIGSLVAGKDADIVAVDLSGLAQQPVYDPVSHLSHAVDRANVTHAWIAGAPVLADRRLLTLDGAALAATARAWRARLQSP